MSDSRNNLSQSSKSVEHLVVQEKSNEKSNSLPTGVPTSPPIPASTDSSLSSQDSEPPIVRRFRECSEFLEKMSKNKRDSSDISDVSSEKSKESESVRRPNERTWWQSAWRWCKARKNLISRAIPFVSLSVSLIASFARNFQDSTDCDSDAGLTIIAGLLGFTPNLWANYIAPLMEEHRSFFDERIREVRKWISQIVRLHDNTEPHNKALQASLTTRNTEIILAKNVLNYRNYFLAIGALVLTVNDILGLAYKKEYLNYGLFVNVGAAILSDLVEYYAGIGNRRAQIEKGRETMEDAVYLARRADVGGLKRLKKLDPAKGFSLLGNRFRTLQSNLRDAQRFFSSYQSAQNATERQQYLSAMEAFEKEHKQQVSLLLQKYEAGIASQGKTHEVLDRTTKVFIHPGSLSNSAK